jgi:carboxyl-terminal processing protease
VYQVILNKSVVLVTTVVMMVGSCSAQRITGLERERAQVMLQNVASDIRKYYYDPKLRGVDWDAKVKEAKEKIAKATTRDEATLEIAAALEPLDDSHTIFVPPHDPFPLEYGWRLRMVGNHCYVTHVRPKSDAEAKGLQAGDEVLTIEGFAPTREGLPKIEYVISSLMPRSSLRVELRDHSGKIRRLDLKAKSRQVRTVTDVGDVTGREQWGLRLEYENEIRLARPKYRDIGASLMIIKLPEFLYPGQDADQMIERARKYGALILDLRGNPGGAEFALQNLVSSVFENDVKIADRVGRDSKKTVEAKSSHRNSFTGKLIVLVDGDSASAAELFARVIQIEKRGIVVGDRSSGMVMEARYYDHVTGQNPSFRYGTSVSSADLVMADGKSLEHTGVIPDELSLPTAADLASGRDPVMAHAAELAGVTLSAEDAGKLFPYEWPRE